MAVSREPGEWGGRPKDPRRPRTGLWWETLQQRIRESGASHLAVPPAPQSPYPPPTGIPESPLPALYPNPAWQ